MTFKIWKFAIDGGGNECWVLNESVSLADTAAASAYVVSKEVADGGQYRAEFAESGGITVVDPTP